MSLSQQRQINILKKQVQLLVDDNNAVKRELLTLKDIVKNKIERAGTHTFEDG